MIIGTGFFGFTSSGSGGGGSTTTVSSLSFLIGDGGPYTPAAGQPVFNPVGNPLVGATVIAMFGGGLFISPTADAAPGDLSYAFVSGTGVITLSNGNFDNGVTYSIIYETTS